MDNPASYPDIVERFYTRDAFVGGRTGYGSFNTYLLPGRYVAFDLQDSCLPIECYALDGLEGSQFIRPFTVTPAAVHTNTQAADLIVSASTGVAGGRATATLTVTGAAHRSGVLRFQNVGGAQPVSLAIYRFKPGKTDALQCARIGTPPGGANPYCTPLTTGSPMFVSPLNAMSMPYTLAPGDYVFADTVTNTNVYVHHFEYGGLATAHIS